MPFARGELTLTSRQKRAIHVGWPVRVQSTISRKFCQTLLFHSRGDDNLYRIDKIYSDGDSLHRILSKANRV